jgi:hypothetical protein
MKVCGACSIVRATSDPLLTCLQMARLLELTSQHCRTGHTLLTAWPVPKQHSNVKVPNHTPSNEPSSGIIFVFV